jgi:hypothetical protein
MVTWKEKGLVAVIGQARNENTILIRKSEGKRAFGRRKSRLDFTFRNKESRPTKLIKIFNSLSSNLTALIDKQAQFKVLIALKKIFNHTLLLLC